MASQLNKYAQNIARARYATPTSVMPRRRATIDPSLFSGKTAAKGAPLASRAIEGGPELPSPQEYNPIIDAESGEDPNAPRVETQQPIENRGGSARYMIQGGGPRIDLSFLVPERANPQFDPSKAIGGENVPYQESTGVGGFFRRMLGDESNRMNIEAQQAQGAEWREAAKEQEKENRLLKRMEAANEPLQKRFETEMEFRKGESADAKANREAQLALEKERLAESKADRAARLQTERQGMLDRVTQQQIENEQRNRELQIRSDAAKPARYAALGNTGLFQTPEGELGVFDPGMPSISPTMPGRPAGVRMLPKPGSAPKRAASMGDEEVDRVTGEPISKPSGSNAPAPAAAVTAPRSGTWPGVGEVKPDVTGLYYTSEPQGSSTLLKETGAFDVPESVTKEMTQYAMSPEQRMNILKRYHSGLRSTRAGFPKFAE